MKRPHARPSSSERRRWRHHIGTTASVTAAVLAALHAARVAADENPPVSEGDLQQIVVTATRRAVSAQDLPISITAISGDSLAQAGIHDMEGLAQSVAGVDFTDKGPFDGINGSSLIIRGLNSESLSYQEGLATPVVPPVATYVDDTPLFFNVRLQDLDRVEILRGPQGTLYGSGSLGGTIRFVQNAPDPSGFDARAEVGASDTAHTHEPNEMASGMLNLPVTDTIALRLNAGASYDAGFINQTNLYRLGANGVPLPSQPLTASNPVGLDPQIGPQIYSEDGVNKYQYRDARVAALWKPGDQFKAQLSYYYQSATASGFPYVATNPLAYTQPIAAANQYLPYGTQSPVTNPPNILSLFPATVPAGTDSLTSATNSLEGTRDEVNLVALNLDYDMGFATLTSSSSWAHHNNMTHDDLTDLYVNFNFYQNLYGQNPRSFFQARDQLDDKVWAQEFRLASKGGTALDWIVGLFYKNEKTYIQQHEFYPGYNAFYNACSAAGYPPSDYSGVNGSACGLGEYAQLPGGTSTVDGIPLAYDQSYIGDFETTFKDLALFGELTWHLTSRWSLTGGARIFKQSVDQAQQTGLLFDGPGSIANTSLSDEWRRPLWKINTAYQLTEHDLVYATWSQGFRRGGVNALPPSEIGGTYTTPPALSKLQPDTADNYEIGAKGTLSKRFSYSLAIYDIDWYHVQEGTSLTPLSLPASANIGDATSRGAELELTAGITQHLIAQVGYTYDQTKVTSFNPLFVENATVRPPPPGGPLPGTPKESLALGLEYRHVKLAHGELRFALDAHYQSSLLSSISASALTVPSYTMLNGRICYAWSHFLATIYVDNISNTLGINAYTDPAFWGNRYEAIVSQPRTAGVRFAYSFNAE
jgi:iron complex outermembrane recepter protein